jgi:hypothetical protein
MIYNYLCLIVFFIACLSYFWKMKARSVSYVSKTLQEVEKFSVTVFQSVGETILKYADLAKHGNVAVREADSFAASAGQYGWMAKTYGKGYAAIASVCTSLRTPFDETEKNRIYLTAFQSPPLYKILITEFNGKKTTEEGLKISLIRTHGFTDGGAKVAAKVFIDNAKFLGLINDDNIFNIEADIIIHLNTTKEQQPKVKASQVHNKKPHVENLKSKIMERVPPLNNPNSGHSATKKIALFIRGHEYLLPVPEDMNQSDWDAIIKQVQNIKSFSK